MFLREFQHLTTTAVAKYGVLRLLITAVRENGSELIGRSDGAHSLSNYERQRLANIEENRAQLAMLGLGASEAGASEGASKVVAKARPSRGAAASADSKVELRRSGRSKKPAH